MNSDFTGKHIIHTEESPFMFFDPILMKLKVLDFSPWLFKKYTENHPPLYAIDLFNKNASEAATNSDNWKYIDFSKEGLKIEYAPNFIHIKEAGENFNLIATNPILKFFLQEKPIGEYCIRGIICKKVNGMLGESELNSLYKELDSTIFMEILSLRLNNTLEFLSYAAFEKNAPCVIERVINPINQERNYIQAFDDVNIKKFIDNEKFYIDINPKYGSIAGANYYFNKKKIDTVDREHSKRCLTNDIIVPEYISKDEKEFFKINSIISSIDFSNLEFDEYKKKKEDEDKKEKRRDITTRKYTKRVLKFTAKLDKPCDESIAYSNNRIKEVNRAIEKELSIKEGLINKYKDKDSKKGRKLLDDCNRRIKTYNEQIDALNERIKYCESRKEDNMQFVLDNLSTLTNNDIKEMIEYIKSKIRNY